jgi:hypothetical protein
VPGTHKWRAVSGLMKHTPRLFSSRSWGRLEEEEGSSQKALTALSER